MVLIRAILLVNALLLCNGTGIQHPYQVLVYVIVPIRLLQMVIALTVAL
jgi:hypothetical protein